MSSVDGELGSSGCISPIIRAAAFSSLAQFPLSLFTLPPLSVHLLKFSLFQDLFFSPLLLLLLLYSSLSPHHLHAPSLPPSPPPAATARPRLWFKHDGHPFEARGHHHHHPGSSAASSALDQFNQHREGDAAESPTYPPTPTLGLLRLNLKGKNGWRCWGGCEGRGHWRSKPSVSQCHLIADAKQ